MVINQSINQLPTRSQGNNCLVVPMTGFFWQTFVLGVFACSEAGGAKGLAILNETWEHSCCCCHVTSQILLAYVTLTENMWEVDRWPIFSQAFRSHDVPCVRKWQMFVKYVSRRKATWNSCERESTCKQWRNLVRGTVLTCISMDGLNKITIKPHRYVEVSADLLGEESTASFFMAED
jgi:hypothetical protein